MVKDRIKELYLLIADKERLQVNVNTENSKVLDVSNGKYVSKVTRSCVICKRIVCARVSAHDHEWVRANYGIAYSIGNKIYYQF